MTTLAPRRQPRVPFSAAFALCKWRVNNDRDAVIAVLYNNQEELTKDYARVGQWQYRPGASARIRNAYLERAPGRRGVHFFDVGWRQYFSPGADRRFEELKEERITVPVVLGGCNRAAVIKRLHEIDEMFIIFSTISSFEDSDELHALARQLYRGQLVSFGDTEPIQIRGLAVFGRFIPTGSWREQPMTS